MRCVTADDLARIAGRGRTTVYRNLSTEPPPLWLLQAFADWYQQNKPLEPAAIDEAYRQILFDLWPKPPVDPSPNKPSRKRRTKEASDAEHVRDESAADPEVPLHASSRAPSRPRSNAADRTPRQPGLQDAPVEEAAPADLPIRLPDIGRLDFTRVDLEGWTRAFYEAPEGCVQITRRAIISRIQQCPAYPLKKTEFAIKQKLSQTWRKLLRGRPARTRRIDPELHDNRAWVCELLAGWIFAEERREPHAKGAYSKRAWMDDLPKLRAAYDCFRDQIVARLGREPSIHTVATWCRDLYGKSDKVERAKEHYQETIGFRARFSGEVWFLDATGLPFQVDGVQAAANRQGKVAQWAHLRTDLASGQTHTWWNPGKSETDGWSDAMIS
ncbi:MAG: hypothetical protein L6R28_18875, partial [Planctomycetes bacterium]|nr:hypothetical protein [Planctomycetota bacterium]